MLAHLTVDAFRPRLGELFHVVLDDGSRLPTKLTGVNPWGAGPAAGSARTPFSLVFHTVPAAVLPQRIYRMENEQMAPFEIFLTPLGPDERGMRYEAVFA
jgi:hypothetical protein